MTLISSVPIVLLSNLKDKTSPSKSLQHVIDGIEEASQQQVRKWGTEKYCLRCGGYGHTKSNSRGRPWGPCHVRFHCLPCA